MAKNEATLQTLVLAVFEGKEEITDKDWNGYRQVQREPEDIMYDYLYVCKEKNIVFNFDNGEKEILEYVKVSFQKYSIIITIHWVDAGGWVFDDEGLNDLTKD